MRIGEVAEYAGVGVETVRFYEREGLVRQPQRPAGPRCGGFRVYPTETVARIHFIREAQEIGFSLREIKELLSIQANPNADCGEVQTQARSKLSEVNKKIARLTQMQAALKELIATCPGQSAALSECSVMRALTRGALM